MSEVTSVNFSASNAPSRIAIQSSAILDEARVSSSADPRIAMSRLPFLGLLCVLSACQGTVSNSATDFPGDSPLGGSGSVLGADQPSTGTVDGVCDIQTIFQRYNCTSCHSSDPDFNGGGLDLVSDGLAQRLIDRPSVNPSCSDEVVVDLADPEASLLLRSVAPERYAVFNSDCDLPVMPLVSDARLEDDEVDCLEDWIRGLDVSSGPVDPTIPGDAFTVLSKTKYMMHGGAVTAEELAQASDESGKIINDELRDLVRQWMETSEFKAKRRHFLTLSLQQDPADLNYFLQFRNTNGRDSALMRDNLKMSMIRTAERIVDADEDFRTIATTNEWEVTTLVLLALKVADNPVAVNKRNNPKKYTLANDIRYWHRSGVTDFLGPDAYDWRTVRLVHNPDSTDMMHGPSLESEQYEQYVAEADANIRKLRNVPHNGTVELRAPRVGFFTTPAFFQVWQTNFDNDFRLTLNQSLIVATGQSFSPGDTTPVNTDLSAVDLEMFPETSECYGCHKNMEPMRLAWLQSYDSTRTRQYYPDESLPQADFAFQGHSVPMNTMQDFAAALASHPNFGRAWVCKLTQYATSQKCDPNDPRIRELAREFAESGYRLSYLFERFFSSPLATDTSDREDSVHPGAQVSIARRSHFCHASEVRLDAVRRARGLDESGDAHLCSSSDEARLMSGAIPDDEFVRGAVHLEQPRTMEAFTAVAYEGLCVTSAADVVDGRSTGIFDSLDEVGTLDLMVEHVLGAPVGTQRFSDERETLQRIYDVQRHETECSNPAALRESLESTRPQCGLGLGKEAALRNIWTIACQSPALSSIGL